MNVMQDNEEKITHSSESYPNPTIAEALCEIHFYSKSEYDDSKFQEIKKALSIHYPFAATQKIRQYKANVKESGVTVEEEKDQTSLWTFKHKDRNHLIQVRPGILTINEVGDYPGWKVVLADISKGWEIISQSFPLLSVKRIGLRYVNLVRKKDANEPLGVWLKESEFYPKALLYNKSGYFSRSEFNDISGVRLIVTISEPTDYPGGIVFDIDAISSFIGKNELSDILKELNHLHDTVKNKVFFQSLTNKYENHLEGKL